MLMIYCVTLTVLYILCDTDSVVHIYCVTVLYILCDCVTVLMCRVEVADCERCHTGLEDQPSLQHCRERYVKLYIPVRRLVTITT